MARKTLSKEGLPFPAQQAVASLGENLRIARKRRGLSLDEMAGAMLVTRKTLSRLEAGDSTVGIYALVSALHVLGMVSDLGKIASPETDAIGIFSEKQLLPKRVRKKRTPPDELDF